MRVLQIFYILEVLSIDFQWNSLDLLANLSLRAPSQALKCCRNIIVVHIPGPLNMIFFTWNQILGCFLLLEASLDATISHHTLSILLWSMYSA